MRKKSTVERLITEFSFSGYTDKVHSLSHPEFIEKEFYIIQGTLATFRLPSGSASKEYACNAGDTGMVPGSARFPVEGSDSPLQYSSLKTSMDRGAWQATAHSIAKSWT